MGKVFAHMGDGLQSVRRIGTRASRATYGWTFLVWAVVFAVIPEAQLEGPAGTAVSLGVVVLCLPLWVRRMHDINRSGWWLLLFWWLWMILMFFIPSSAENRWGPPAGKKLEPLDPLPRVPPP